MVVQLDRSEFSLIDDLRDKMTWRIAANCERPIIFEFLFANLSFKNCSLMAALANCVNSKVAENIGREIAIKQRIRYFSPKITKAIIMVS